MCRTGHKVEDPCVSDSLDISTIDRDSLEIFTPDVNNGRGSVDNDFNCSVRLDYDSIMKVIISNLSSPFYRNTCALMFIAYPKCLCFAYT